jgi:structural maintenance of chromosome 2
MYIKEVNIDGFKSYAQRVCLSQFDPGFNAITGLNGSGKSNILDSLCFVMGIKNLSAVSASSTSNSGNTHNIKALVFQADAMHSLQ